MKSNINQKLNYLIVFLTIIVALFGYVVLKGTDETYAYEDPSGDSYGTIPAETTVYTEVSTSNICDSFYIGRKETVASVVTNNFRANNGYNPLGMIIYEATVDTADEDCKDDTSEYTAYCIDPANPGPDDTSLKYNWERDLNPNGNNPSNKFDAGMLYIYQNAYPNKDIPGLNDSQNLAAVEIAARMLTYHYGFQYTGNPTYASNAKGFLYTTKTVDGTCGSDGNCALYNFRNAHSVDILAAAKQLYQGALNANIDSLWTHDLKFADTVTAEKTEAQAGGTFTKIVRDTLSGQSAFNGEDPEKSYVKNLRVTCDNEAITCEILGAGGSPISADTLLNKGVDPLEFQIKISGNLADMDAKELEVTVEVDYFDNRDSSTGFIAYSTDYGANYQRMVLFADKTVRTMKQVFKISMCDIDMTQFVGDTTIEEYFYNYCDSQCMKSPMLTPGNASFDAEEFVAQGCCSYLSPGDATYDEYCAVNCIQHNWMNECGTASENVINVTEGIDIKDTGEMNYDLCVLDKDAWTPANAPKDDLAGNTLQMSGQGVDNNKYCAVACIEAWEFTLPGPVYEVRAGTYFMLSAKMEGTRTCVTTDIKYGSQDGQYIPGYFLRDLDDVNEAIVEAYNEWTFWDEAVKAPEQVGDLLTCDEYTSVTCTNCGGPNQSPCPSCCNRHSGTKSENQKYKEWESDVYKYTPDSSNPGYGDVSYVGKDNGDDAIGYWETSGDCSISCSWEPEDWSHLEAARAAAEARYHQLISDREKMIQQIKACSEWENNFNYDPILSYAYEENYYMSEFIGENNYFIAQSNSEPSGPSTYCQDLYAKDDSYECQGGSSGSSMTEQKIESHCAIGSGCWTEQVTVPKNQSILQEKTNSALYKPFTVFYTMHPTGEMKGEAVAIEDDISETGVITRLGRVFPVRMTTPQGVYNYKFVFNQVGQYNDEEDELGRLMNYTTSSVDGETEPEITVNSQFIQTRPSVFEAIGVSPLYLCTYEVYEDVCKCCGEDDFDIDGDGITSGSGGGSASGFGVNEEGYLTYYYRPVSLTDPFPNNSDGSLTGTRPVGSNWTDAKGQYVYDRITAEGEFAYEEPEYSYVLTPNGTASIRSYNRSQDGVGGFSDFALTCNEDGYQCTSMFLENLDDIVGYDATKVTPTADNKWTCWSDATNSVISCDDSSIKRDEDSLPTGVGPALK